MNGHNSLFASILASSIWREAPSTKLVWITMIALANEEGYVGAAVNGLAHLAGVSVSDCEAALAILMAPDEYSRSKENEGRRVVEAERGWVLLNHAKYRDMARTDHARMSDSARKAKRRQDYQKRPDISGHFRKNYGDALYTRASESEFRVVNPELEEINKQNSDSEFRASSVPSGAAAQEVREGWAEAWFAMNAGAPPRLTGQVFMSAVAFAMDVARTHDVAPRAAARAIAEHSLRQHPSEPYKQTWALSQLDPFAKQKAEPKTSAEWFALGAKLRESGASDVEWMNAVRKGKELKEAELAKKDRRY